MIKAQVQIQGNGSKAGINEYRFNRSSTVEQLKFRLETITGIPADYTLLSLSTVEGGEDLGSLEGEPDRQLASFIPFHLDNDANCFLLLVKDIRPEGKKIDWNDLDSAQKFELSDEAYATRQESLLQYKLRNKLGRFANDHGTPNNAPKDPENIEHLQVGNRCKVETEEVDLPKIGHIRYIGEIDKKPGVWVGVEYDEPIGKHDGSLSGKRYFEARPKHGVFVRPAKVSLLPDSHPEENFDDEDEI